MLMHFQATLAHQFECCGKTRSANCRGVRGLDHVGDEIVIEHAPVGRAPDQPFQRLTRFGERPDRALGHAHEGSGLLLPLPRIGRKQIVECCRPLRPFDLGDRLRPPARKHLTAELRPVEQLFGHLPDRLEPPQALREGSRHVLGADAVGLGLLRQQQARFEIRKPRGHHQVIGGKLQPQLARLFDEGKVLVGKRQDRDFRQVHLLLAGKRQQQIERALKALDVDHQRGLVCGPLRELGEELQVLADHAYPRAGCQAPAMSFKNSERAAGRSMGAAGFFAARAAAARHAVSPASKGASAATASISGISPLQ